MDAEPRRRPWPEVKREEQRRYPGVYAAYEAFLRAVKAGEHPRAERPMITVERPEEMPLFQNEAEEHEFWGVHDLGDAWFDLAEPIPDDEFPPVRQRTPPPSAHRRAP